jgi:hypothetical protein
LAYRPKAKKPNSHQKGSGPGPFLKKTTTFSDSKWFLADFSPKTLKKKLKSKGLNLKGLENLVRQNDPISGRILRRYAPKLLWGSGGKYSFSAFTPRRFWS